MNGTDAQTRGRRFVMAEKYVTLFLRAPEPKNVTMVEFKSDSVFDKAILVGLSNNAVVTLYVNDSAATISKISIREGTCACRVQDQ